MADTARSSFKLNYPYYLYPGSPCSGYFEIGTYNKELMRLNNEIINLSDSILGSKQSSNILFHLTIGAAMEEVLLEYKNSSLNIDPSEFQWQQLLPDHIRRAVNDGINVIHFIVSPNMSFSDDKFIEPRFIKNTQEYSWEKDDNKTYIAYKSNCKYIVMIFNTMIPSIDNRNSQICDRLRKHFSEIGSGDVINEYVQTDNDRLFVSQFYKNLDKLVSTINNDGGIVTCFSFAVFNAETDRRRLRNYIMFPEIMKLFSRHSRNLLAEWTYYHDNYLMILCDKCDYKANDGISYVKKSFRHDRGDHIKIYFDFKSGILKLNFLEKYNLEKNELKFTSSAF